jgi:hypothetical protein
MMFIAQPGLEALMLLSTCLVVGISLSTLGKVWPQAALTREQFSGLDAEVESTTELTVEMVDTDRELNVTLEDVGEFTVKVEVLDTETRVVVDDSGLTVKLECK